MLTGCNSYLFPQIIIVLLFYTHIAILTYCIKYLKQYLLVTPNICGNNYLFHCLWLALHNACTVYYLHCTLLAINIVCTTYYLHCTLFTINVACIIYCLRCILLVMFTTCITYFPHQTQIASFI
jgi:hypothetical protein